jgi:PTH1 family peptidyl-tRNA hydrolase
MPLKQLKKKVQQNNCLSMKYLIVGLGNIGDEYDGTRHNIGFRVLDAFAKASNISFEDKRYGFVGMGRVKNAEVVLLKPSTYMNLSGNAVRYWMNKENIQPENLLIVCDDLALPFGKLRLRPSGSDGGHNGLKNIASVLCSQQWARIRFGVGNDFPRGTQIDFVLGQFEPEELEKMDERVGVACEMIKAFCLSGITFAMNNYNNK